MTSIVSFPIKMSPLEEAVQRLLEHKPDWALIIMADENGYSFIAPPDVAVSELNLALDFSKMAILEGFYED